MNGEMVNTKLNGWYPPTVEGTYEGQNIRPSELYVIRTGRGGKNIPFLLKPYISLCRCNSLPRHTTFFYKQSAMLFQVFLTMYE